MVASAPGSVGVPAGINHVTGEGAMLSPALGRVGAREMIVPSASGGPFASVIK